MQVPVNNSHPFWITVSLSLALLLQSCASRDQVAGRDLSRPEAIGIVTALPDYQPAKTVQPPFTPESYVEFQETTGNGLIGHQEAHAR